MAAADPEWFPWSNGCQRGCGAANSDDVLVSSGAPRTTSVPLSVLEPSPNYGMNSAGEELLDDLSGTEVHPNNTLSDRNANEVIRFSTVEGQEKLKELHMSAPPSKQSSEAKRKKELLSKLHLTAEENKSLTDEEREEREGIMGKVVLSKMEGITNYFRSSRGMNEFFDNEPENGSLAWLRWKVGCTVEHPICQMIVALLVAMNGVIIGLFTDKMISDEVNHGFQSFFLIIFNIEIFLKIFAFGLPLYLRDVYNKFDVVIIMCSNIDMMVMAIADVGESNTSAGGGDADTALGISVLRLFRILRVVRLMSSLRRMEMIIDAFLTGMKEVIWIMAIMFLVLYMGGVVLTQWLAENEDLPMEYREQWYSSVGMSMLTLFKVMTMEWSDIVSVTGKHVQAAYFFYVGFLIFCGMGMMGLFAAVFVESLMKATLDEEKQKIERMENMKTGLKDDLMDLMHTADVDDSETLDLEEMQLVLDLLDRNPHGANAEQWDAWRQEIQWKMSAVGLESHTIQSAIHLAAVTLGQGSNVDGGVPYAEIIDAVFTMERAATRGDGISLQANLKADIEIMKQNQARMEETMLKGQERMEILLTKLLPNTLNLDLGLDPSIPTAKQINGIQHEDGEWSSLH